jgi:hypothetical protein
MNIPKHAAGILLFIFIAVISIWIVSIVAAPLEIIPTVALHEPKAAYKPAEASEQVSQISYRVQLVSLDFINRESYTTLKLKRQPDGPAPGKLWVCTSFFVPEYPQKEWSSALVEINEPFAGGDEVSLTVTGACPSCADASAPRAGYYARVSLSTVQGDSACGPGERAQTDIKTAIPVLVQVGRNGRR